MATQIVGSLLAKLTLDQTQFVSATGGAVTGMRGMGSAMGKLSNGFQSMNSELFRASAVLTGMSVGLIALNKSIATVSYGYDKNMTIIRAVTNATSEEMENLGGIAREMGKETIFGATKAAEGLLVLSRMGLRAADSMKVLEPAMKLAQGQQHDMTSTTELVVQQLRAFGKETKDADSFANVLAATSSKTAADLTKLENALSFAGPVAKLAGISFEEVNATLGLMFNAGIKASRAGTSLRFAIAALLGATSKSEKALGRLGLTVRDVSPNFNSMEDILKKLSSRLEGTSDKAAIIFDIFGKRAAPAMGAVLSAILDNSNAFSDLQKSITGTNEVQRQFAEQQNSFYGQVNLLKTALEDLAIEFGEVMLPAFQKGIVLLRSFVQFLKEMPDIIKKSIAGFLIFATVATTLLAALTGLGFVLSTISALLSGLLPLIMATAVAMAGLAGPLTLVIGLLATAATGFAILKTRQIEHKQAILDLADSVDSLNKAYETSEEKVAGLRKQLENSNLSVMQRKKLEDELSGALGESKKALRALAAEHPEIIKSYNAITGEIEININAIRRLTQAKKDAAAEDNKFSKMTKQQLEEKISLLKAAATAAQDLEVAAHKAAQISANKSSLLTAKFENKDYGPLQGAAVAINASRARKEADKLAESWQSAKGAATQLAADVIKAERTLAEFGDTSGKASKQIEGLDGKVLGLGDSTAKTIKQLDGLLNRLDNLNQELERAIELSDIDFELIGASDVVENLAIIDAAFDKKIAAFQKKISNARAKLKSAQDKKNSGILVSNQDLADANEKLIIAVDRLKQFRTAQGQVVDELKNQVLTGFFDEIESAALKTEGVITQSNALLTSDFKKRMKLEVQALQKKNRAEEVAVGNLIKLKKLEAAVATKSSDPAIAATAEGTSKELEGLEAQLHKLKLDNRNAEFQVEKDGANRVAVISMGFEALKSRGAVTDAKNKLKEINRQIKVERAGIDNNAGVSDEQVLLLTVKRKEAEKDIASAQFSAFSRVVSAVGSLAQTVFNNLGLELDGSAQALVEAGNGIIEAVGSGSVEGYGEGIISTVVNVLKKAFTNLSEVLHEAENEAKGVASDRKQTATDLIKAEAALRVKTLDLERGFVDLLQGVVDFKNSVNDIIQVGNARREGIEALSPGSLFNNPEGGAILGQQDDVNLDDLKNTFADQSFSDITSKSMVDALSSDPTLRGIYTNAGDLTSFLGDLSSVITSINAADEGNLIIGKDLVEVKSVLDKAFGSGSNITQSLLQLAESDLEVFRTIMTEVLSFARPEDIKSGVLTDFATLLTDEIKVQMTGIIPEVEEIFSRIPDLLADGVSFGEIADELGNTIDILKERAGETIKLSTGEVMSAVSGAAFKSIGDRLFSNRIAAATAEGSASGITDAYAEREGLLNFLIDNAKSLDVSADTQYNILEEIAGMPDALSKAIASLTGDVTGSNQGDKIETAANKIVSAFENGTISYSEATSKMDQLRVAIDRLPIGMQNEFVDMLDGMDLIMRQSVGGKREEAEGVVAGITNEAEDFSADITAIDDEMSKVIDNWNTLISARADLLAEFEQEAADIKSESADRIKSLEEERAALLGVFDFGETQNVRSKRFADARNVESKILGEIIEAQGKLDRLNDKFVSDLDRIESRLLDLELEYGNITVVYEKFALDRAAREQEYITFLETEGALLEELSGRAIDFAAAFNSMDIASFIEDLKGIDVSTLFPNIGEPDAEAAANTVADLNSAVSDAIATSRTVQGDVAANSNPLSPTFTNEPETEPEHKSFTLSSKYDKYGNLFAANGFEGIVNKPTHITAGEGSSPEYVSIQPLDGIHGLAQGLGGGGGTTIIINETIDLRGAYGVDDPAVAQKVWKTVWEPARRGAMNRVLNVRGKVTR